MLLFKCHLTLLLLLLLLLPLLPLSCRLQP
jgi:hypothetical protein